MRNGSTHHIQNTQLHNKTCKTHVTKKSVRTTELIKVILVEHCFFLIF